MILRPEFDNIHNQNHIYFIIFDRKRDGEKEVKIERAPVVTYSSNNSPGGTRLK